MFYCVFLSFLATGGETEVTFTFLGDCTGEEQMIVDDNTPDINNDLQEEVNNTIVIFIIAYVTYTDDDLF